MASTTAQRQATPRAGDLVAGYLAHGFHLERDVLDRKACVELIDGARTLPSFVAGDVSPANNPHLTNAEFLGALRHPTIVRLAAELAGGPVVGLQTQVLFTVPGTPGFRVHQDNFYIQTAPDALLSAWVALEDSSAENGGLFAYPGSQREPILPVEDVAGAVPHPAQTWNGLRLETRVPPGYVRTNVDVPAGAAVFIHGQLLHGSHTNASARTRMALLMSYVRKGEPFRRGERGQRTAIEVH